MHLYGNFEMRHGMETIKTENICLKQHLTVIEVDNTYCKPQFTNENMLTIIIYSHTDRTHLVYYKFEY